MRDRTRLALALAVCTMFFAVQASASVRTEAGREANSTVAKLWRSWYGSATRLLPTVERTGPDAAKAKSEEHRLVGEVKVLAEALRREEHHLEHLLEDRAAIKRQSWTWFLDPQLRTQVDAAGLKINNQRRKVEALFDDISVHWRQLKPLHGVMSSMFAWELFAFLLSPILSVLDFFASVLSFGLVLFFLLLGPAAFFFTMFAFSLGLALLPIIGASLVLIWTFEFPWMIIQYNPTALEFLVAYSPFVIATVWLATRMTRSLRPIRQWRTASIAARAQDEPRPSPATAGRRTDIKID